MSDHTSFIEIFPGCAGLKNLCGGLDKAYVTDVAVSAADMIMSVSAHFARMPAPAEISNICEKIRRDYGFNTVELIPEYHQPKVTPAPAGAKPKAESNKPTGTVLMGRTIKGKPVPMSELTLDSGSVVIEGDVFDVTSRKLTKRDGAVLCFDITDNTGSIRISKYLSQQDDQSVINAVSKGDHLFIAGNVTYNRFENDMVLDPKSIMKGKKVIRPDNAEEKRVELHMHTRFSTLDALTDPAAIVKRAAYWGMPAIAVTDHGVCQAFPDMWQAGKKNGVKIIYGLECYFVNDMDGSMAVHVESKLPLDTEMVAFDIETTGLNAGSDRMTEIGAVSLQAMRLRNHSTPLLTRECTYLPK